MVTYSPFESYFQDPLDSFTNRESILEEFTLWLAVPEGGNYLLAVKGNSGAGKTFLINYLSQRLCLSLTPHWCMGHLAFTQGSDPTFSTILTALESALAGCTPSQPFQQYCTKRDKCISSFDEYRNAIFINVEMRADNAATLCGNMTRIQVDAQLHERELHLRSELSSALVELASSREHPLCLFIDSYERLSEASPDLIAWLLRDLLPRIARAGTQPLRIITCGWEWPGASTVEPLQVRQLSLEDFNKGHVQQYLEKRGVLTPSQKQNEELIDAFYYLSGGHPLALALAVTYFFQLPEQDRSAVSLLQNHRALIDDKARIEFLDERLLERLSEPHRTLLERGPLLRTFDSAALRILLSIELEGTSIAEPLDDRTYERFLHYPFIEPGRDNFLAQPSFHDLVRRVRLEALRRHHPETKQRLHRTMADYYKQIVEAERAQKKPARAPQSKTVRAKGLFSRVGQWFQQVNTKTTLGEHAFTDGFTEIPEREFTAQLEYLYHAFQVEELQTGAFEEWVVLTEQALNRGHIKQAGLLLKIVQQLALEGESLGGGMRDVYPYYIFWNSRLLTQILRWDDARATLEEAAKVFEKVGNLAYSCTCFSNIGVIHASQGKVAEALSYFERALKLAEQMGNPAMIATALSNIGFIHSHHGKLVEALRCHERALMLLRQVSGSDGIANALNNIGTIYRQQGKTAEALRCFEEGLKLREQVGNPADIAHSLNEIGFIFDRQGKVAEALRCYERALMLQRQVSDPAGIASSLNNIGTIYGKQGKTAEALSCFEEALKLFEQVGDPAKTSYALNNIGRVYHRRGKLAEALHYFEEALKLREQVGDPAGIASSLDDIGTIYGKQGKTAEALSCFEEALKLREQVGDPVEIAASLHSIGDFYEQQERWAQAIAYSIKSLGLYEQMGKGFELEVLVELLTLSNCYLRLGERGKSLSYFGRARQLRWVLGEPSQRLE